MVKKNYKKQSKLTECLFTGNVKELTDEEIEMVFKGMPTIETKRRYNNKYNDK